jgi:hypothetical protein
MFGDRLTVKAALSLVTGISKRFLTISLIADYYRSRKLRLLSGLVRQTWQKGGRP